MIRKVTLSNFRGVREGALEDLAPLTILVGPNGCGKSTVLDALLLGSNINQEEAIGTARARMNEVDNQSRWLVFRGDTDIKARLEIRDEHKRSRVLELTVAGRGVRILEVDSKLSAHGLPPRRLEGIPAKNVYEIPLETRLIQPQVRNVGRTLHDMLSWGKKKGYAKPIQHALEQVISGLQSIEVLTLEGHPEVHTIFDWGSVPLGVAGDGIYGLARLAFELAMKPGSLALIEEPETNQHPRSLRMSAKIIWAAVRQSVQVVLSTHSLELIDMLLDESYREDEEDDLEKMGLCRLRLNDGSLTSVWHRGEDIRFARKDIEEDLR